MDLRDRAMWLYVLQDLREKAEYLPQGICFGILGGLILSVTARLLKKKRSNPLILMLQLIYLYMLLMLTIFERETGSRQGVSLKLFETFGNAKSNSYCLENVLLFLPFGAFMGLKLKSVRKLPLCLLIGAICSLLIECVQLLTLRGYFQVDDILTNTIGTGIGFILFLCLYHTA